MKTLQIDRSLLIVAALTWLGAFGYQLAFYGYYQLIGDGFLNQKRFLAISPGWLGMG